MQADEVVQRVHKEHQVGALALSIVRHQHLLPDIFGYLITAQVLVGWSCLVLRQQWRPLYLILSSLPDGYGLLRHVYYSAALCDI